MMQCSMQQLWDNSYLVGDNQSYIESLYETYLNNPADLSAEWREYFAQFTVAQDIKDELAYAQRQRNMRQANSQQAQSSSNTRERVVIDSLGPVVMMLLESYRGLGHLQANLNPLAQQQLKLSAVVDMAGYGFSTALMNKSLPADYLHGFAPKSATLKQLQQDLDKIYCRTLGFEYMHIKRLEEITWFEQRIETDWFNFQLDNATKIQLLQSLIAADGFEKYLGNKYVGQKRFSLEGGDALIPILDTIIKRSAAYGVKEVVCGMAHRGRLNVLANIMAKKPSEIFQGFEGQMSQNNYSGDVKYHLGHSADLVTPYGSIHLSLACNPSHLEIIAPVVQGSVRARQLRYNDAAHDLVIPIHIHGDAAVAGQGVVMECFNMSQARGFTVGGAIHIVINNQIGFTISDPSDARSTHYCSDIAKMIEAPVIHVNGNDPEAAYFAAQLAIEYRHRFKRDIVIDLVCYRRHGHNEADEPAATQPRMYNIIRKMPPLMASYAQQLVDSAVIKPDEVTKLTDTYLQSLATGEALVATTDKAAYQYANTWQAYVGTSWQVGVDSTVALEKLRELAANLAKLPDGFMVQPQVKKMLELRQQMTLGKVAINWGYAETMAYATLLAQGYPIRLCGQDVGRGTFAHRHAVLHDQVSDAVYIPLNKVAVNQAALSCVDSLLSEEAVLAFEYGYAATDPGCLTIWEAQFGDFANGAQVVIDQFISSSEQKWGKYCGLVMFLPHGYEGMGPEHSSARLERYLQLCAQDNIQVCQPTTPAQFFHLLRRQMLRPYRKPLVVFTPKSLLRHNAAVSALKDLTTASFLLVYPDVELLPSAAIERIVLCSGKVYYDLLEQRIKLGLTNIALLRIEQLYPFPDSCLAAILAAYPPKASVVWCQEEPENQGAWSFMRYNLAKILGSQRELFYAGRDAAASTATGYHNVHQVEQAALIAQAFK